MLLLGHRKGRIREGLERFFAPGRGCLAAAGRQDHRDAVVPQPRGKIVLRRPPASLLSHLTQEILCAPATEAVGNPLKIIEVDHRQPSDRSLGAFRATI